MYERALVRKEISTYYIYIHVTCISKRTSSNYSNPITAFDKVIQDLSNG